MSSLHNSAVQVGELLDARYRIVRRLGEGAAGSVFAAEDRRLGGLVAIKVLKPSLFGERLARERFHREIRATMRIRCDYIVRTLDVGHLENGIPFMVMEYHDGYDLARAIAERGVLPLHRAVEHTLQVCVALAHTHRVGIVHRDIKPANLLLARLPDGREVVRVMDFGISKIAANSPDAVPTKLTGNAVRLGSPMYMSPEQRTLGRDVDERTDIWSLGITLFEMIAGVVPFDSNPPSLRSGSEAPSTVPSLSRHRPEIPPAFDRVIARCLQHSPELRYQNVAELAEALTAFDVVIEGRPNAKLVAEVLGRPRLSSDLRPLSMSGFGPGNTLGPAVACGAPAPSLNRRRRWWALLVAAVAVAATVVLAGPHHRREPSHPLSLRSFSAMPVDPAWSQAARSWEGVLPEARARAVVPIEGSALAPQPHSRRALDWSKPLPNSRTAGAASATHASPNSALRPSDATGLSAPMADLGY
ncbi:MAG TPA: serine/threonine-protein kinase [Polyangiaceae bacterium]|nr:serine/threonine-protein kinase [Polyangiaceae bacterium]